MSPYGVVELVDVPSPLWERATQTFNTENRVRGQGPPHPAEYAEIPTMPSPTSGEGKHGGPPQFMPRQCITLGSIGVVPRRPRISSRPFAAARMRASLRGGPAICNPTGKFSRVKPQGSDSAVPHDTVIA